MASNFAMMINSLPLLISECSCHCVRWYGLLSLSKASTRYLEYTILIACIIEMLEGRSHLMKLTNGRQHDLFVVSKHTNEMIGRHVGGRALQLLALNHMSLDQVVTGLGIIVLWIVWLIRGALIVFVWWLELVPKFEITDLATFILVLLKCWIVELILNARLTKFIIKLGLEGHVDLQKLALVSVWALKVSERELKEMQIRCITALLSYIVQVEIKFLNNWIVIGVIVAHLMINHSDFNFFLFLINQVNLNLLWIKFSQ